METYTFIFLKGQQHNWENHNIWIRPSKSRHWSRGRKLCVLPICQKIFEIYRDFFCKSEKIFEIDCEF
jgi:hypothetical protein